MSQPYSRIKIGKGLFRQGEKFEKVVCVTTSSPDLITCYSAPLIKLTYNREQWGKINLTSKLAAGDLICVIINWLEKWSINTTESYDVKFGGRVLLVEEQVNKSFKYTLSPSFFNTEVPIDTQHAGDALVPTDELYNLAVGLVSYRIGQTVERGRGQIEERMFSLLKSKFGRFPDLTKTYECQVLTGNKDLDHIIAVLDYVLHLSSNETYAWLRSGTITSLHRDSAVLHHIIGLIDSKVIDTALYYALDIDIAENLLDAIDVITKPPSESIWMYCSALGFVRRNKYSSTNMPAEFLYTSILCARYENNKIYYARYPSSATADATLLLGCLICLYAGPDTTQGVTLYYQEESNANPNALQNANVESLESVKNIKMAIIRHAILNRIAVCSDFTAQEVKKMKSWVGEKYDRMDTLGYKINGLIGTQHNSYLTKWVSFMEDKSYINGKSFTQCVEIFQKKVGGCENLVKNKREFEDHNPGHNADVEKDDDECSGISEFLGKTI